MNINLTQILTKSNKAPNKSIFSEFTETDSQLLGLLLWCAQHWVINQASQSWIALQLNRTREWVNKRIKFLCLRGFVQKQFRDYRTCIYKISSWLYRFDIWRQLSSIYTFLRYIPIAWIIAATPSTDKKFTPNILSLLKSNYIDNKRDISYCMSKGELGKKKVTWMKTQSYYKNMRENQPETLKARCVSRLYHKPYISKREMPQDVNEQKSKLVDWYQSEEGQEFKRIFGSDIAKKYMKRMLQR